MILDFSDEGAGTEFEAEVVIIGSGAVGLTMAAEWLDAGRKVLVLEAGPRSATEGSEDHYRAQITGHPFGSMTVGRRRVFGGTSTAWGGQFLPLPAHVFEERPWLDAPGWPVTRRDLDPYYARVEQIHALPPASGDDRIWRRAGIAPPALDAALLGSEFSKWAPQPNLAQRFGARLSRSPDVDVLVDAAVVDIRLAADGGAIDHLVVASPNGRRGRVKARFHVLAAGPIESVRILLCADGQDKRGVANRSGLVGRYLQDHVSLIAADVEPAGREHFHQLFEQFLDGPAKLSPKVRLSPAVLGAERLLDSGGFFHLPPPDGAALAAKSLAGSLRRGRWPAGGAGLAVRSLAAMPEVAALSYDAAVRRRIRASRRGAVVLEINAEQKPLANSRLTLSRDTDSLGMRRLIADWRIDDSSRLSARRFAEIIEGEFRRLNIARIAPRSGPLNDPAQFQAQTVDMYHPAGTLRMSGDPQDGVANSDGRAHELENLYIAGSALFPTTGYSNPTHTAMALALRLTDHLRGLLDR